MRHTATTLALTALLAACLLGGCLEGSTSAAPQTAVVDLERIMSQSRAAEAGRAHLAQARQRLEQGFADLQKAWAKAPDEEREAVLRDGALTLRRQMAAAHGQHLVANQRIALHEHDLGGKIANVHQHRDLIALLRRDEQQRLAQRGRR